MKNFAFLIFTSIIFISTIHGQENETNKTFSISIGYGYFDSLAEGYFSGEDILNGANLNADIAYELDNYIFSIYFSSGIEIVNIDQESYMEVSLTVGTAFFKQNQFSIEGHVGLGYFENSIGNYFYGEKEGSICLPLRIKLNYSLTDHIALGINPNLNLNFNTPILSINLMCRYTF